MATNLIVQIALGVLLGFIFLALFVFVVGLIATLFFGSLTVSSIGTPSPAAVAAAIR